MGGGLMQLVSYGAQDIYISGNPQITFWKVLYKRHTNFATEPIEVTFNGQADFNKHVTAVINRNADLMHRAYVQLVLPEVKLTAGQEFRWVNYVGHRLIKQCEVEIGGQRVDRQYGDWMQIWTQLATDGGCIGALDSMIGNTADLCIKKTGDFGNDLSGACSGDQVTDSCSPYKGTPAKTLYVPLQFWFCRNAGSAIPLIALQYHEVRVNIDFETWQNCVAQPDYPAKSLAGASLYVDYVYLDTEERRRFAQQSHEYLIEQVQFTGAESITSSSNKVQLNFNHPVKELFWVVQRDSFVDCTASASEPYGGPQPFNYSDDWSADQMIINDLNDGGTGSETGIGDGSPASGSGGGLNYLLAKIILATGVHCSGKNPVEVAKLQLNGQDRISEREGSYFDKVQPYQHHSRCPTVGINCYSFALRPEEHQPSGTCNFSRIDKATLQLTVSINTVSGSRTAQVRVYALNYNVLRVMSGMGGLAYSN